MLAGNDCPKMPEWISAFMNHNVITPELTDWSPNNLFYKDFSVNVEAPAQPVPSQMDLLSNYPNPFNPTTQIRFQLPSQKYVEIAVFNMIGQKIKTVFAGYKTEGTHEITWDGTDLNQQSVSSGIYLCKMVCDEFVAIKRMVLIR